VFIVRKKDSFTSKREVSKVFVGKLESRKISIIYLEKEHWGPLWDENWEIHDCQIDTGLIECRKCTIL